MGYDEFLSRLLVRIGIRGGADHPVLQLPRRDGYDSLPRVKTRRLVD